MMSFQPKQLPRAPTATGSVRAGNAIRRPYRCAADLPPLSPPTSGIPAGPHRLKAAPDIGGWLGGVNAGDLSAYLARFTTTALSGATTVRARPIDLRARVWSSHRSRRHRVDTYSVPPARAGGGGGPTGAPIRRRRPPRQRRCRRARQSIRKVDPIRSISSVSGRPHVVPNPTTAGAHSGADPRKPPRSGRRRRSHRTRFAVDPFAERNQGSPPGVRCRRGTSGCCAARQ